MNNVFQIHNEATKNKNLGQLKNLQRQIKNKNAIVIISEKMLQMEHELNQLEHFIIDNKGKTDLYSKQLLYYFYKEFAKLELIFAMLKEMPDKKKAIQIKKLVKKLQRLESKIQIFNKFFDQGWQIAF